MLMIGAGVLIGRYLLGPAARFVVTPRELRIDTALYRVRVPRHVIGRFTRQGLEVRLDLTDGDHVYFRVDSPVLDVPRGAEYRTNGRALLRTASKIVMALDQVPAAGPGVGRLVTAFRPGMAVAAIAAMAGVVTGFILLGFAAYA
jgi:hypothetical protein